MRKTPSNKNTGSGRPGIFNNAVYSKIVISKDLLNKPTVHSDSPMENLYDDNVMTKDVSTKTVESHEFTVVSSEGHPNLHEAVFQVPNEAVGYYCLNYSFCSG
jgi:hypothetical protein